MKNTILLSITAIFFLACNPTSNSEVISNENISNEQEIKDGDIIFQTSKSTQSKAIQMATGSRYSHMGIVFISDDGTFVFEAVQPVKLTLLNQWIQRGVGEHFVVKRLKGDEILTEKVLAEMKHIGKTYMGKPYDSFFEWSDDRIYCSELVWKIYYQATGLKLGSLEKLSSFNINEPEVREIITQRYGDKVPLDEVVISPKSIFNSDLLETVIKN